MKIKRRYKQNASKVFDEVNLTPVLDVMLSVLIAFILIAPHLKQGLTIDLPEANGKALQKKTHSITIKKDGSLYWNQNRMSDAQLNKKLLSQYKRDPKTELILKADKVSKFQYFTSVLSDLQEIGYTNISIETESQ